MARRARSTSRWMRILLPAIAAILIAGECTRPPPLDIAALAGTWELEIWRGRWARKHVHGQVTLAPAPIPDCTPEEERRELNGFLCRTHVEGSHSVPLDSLVRSNPYARWTPYAGAISFADGKILLLIGGCCDRGEIVATGRLDGDRIEGGWYQQFLNDRPGGRFVLRRGP
jgi:hypothetical protein